MVSKARASASASGSDGVYFPVSIELIVCRRDVERPGELRLREAALEPSFSDVIPHWCQVSLTH